MVRARSLIALAVLAALAVPFAVPAQEETRDLVPGVPFQEGDVIEYEALGKLKEYVPPEFWENREYFFYEGMEIEIGPFQRLYENNSTYMAATHRFRGQAQIGRDGSLENYTAGLPFYTDDIDCKGDPHSGSKIIWNMMKTWNGSGHKATWSYTYWDRGDRLPLYYEGQARGIRMMELPEPQYEKTRHAIFKAEKRYYVAGVEVVAPFDARGIMILGYRYKSSDGPRDQAKNDDSWFYLPDLRRVRRFSTAQRTDSVAGTDFTADDLRSFDGIPPQYHWDCLGHEKILAPMNTKHLAYPYSEDYNYGPFGFSFANDRWELRDSWVVRFDPKNEDHPYHHKDIYIDKGTYEPLYSFAYDRKQELWKIIWHNHRYSEDWKANDPKAKDGVWYKTWKGVDEVRDLRLTTDIIVNVQTGTGNRIEFVDNHGTPLPSKGKIRRYIDIGRLNKGR